MKQLNCARLTQVDGGCGIDNFVVTVPIHPFSGWEEGGREGVGMLRQAYFLT